MKSAWRHNLPNLENPDIRPPRIQLMEPNDKDLERFHLLNKLTKYYPTVKYSRGWELKEIAEKQKHLFSSSGNQNKKFRFYLD